MQSKNKEKLCLKYGERGAVLLPSTQNWIKNIYGSMGAWDKVHSACILVCASCNCGVEWSVKTFDTAGAGHFTPVSPS